VTDFLVTVHPWLGYVTSVVVLVAALVAFRRAKDAVEFNAGPFSGAMVMLDIVVAIGIVLYAVGGYWDAGRVGVGLAYIHPVLALLALGVGHALLGRARSQQMAVDAHRTAGRGLLLALVLVLAAIGVASARF
jgi:hypothetical protein